MHLVKYLALFVLLSLTGQAQVSWEEVGRAGGGSYLRQPKPVGSLVGVARSNSVRLVDMSDGDNVTVVSDFLVQGYALDIVYQEPYLYVSCYNDIQIFDLCEPSNPQWVGAWSNELSSGFNEMTIHNGRLYVKNVDSVCILDISDPPVRP